MYLLYSILTFVVLVAASPYFLYQALRHSKYVGSIRQRLGHLPISFNLDGDEWRDRLRETCASRDCNDSR